MMHVSNREFGENLTPTTLCHILFRNVYPDILFINFILFDFDYRKGEKQKRRKKFNENKKIIGLINRFKE